MIPRTFFVTLAALALLAPQAAATSTSYTDSDGDSATGHVGLDGFTLASDGTDVTFTLQVDAFSTTQPLTEYTYYFENSQYQGFYFTCFIEGTGSAYSTSCTLEGTQRSPLNRVFNIYYETVPPTFLAVHRLTPPIWESIPFTLDFDAAAGELGFTASYADLQVSSGQWFLANIGWADDTTQAPTDPSQPSSEDRILSELYVTLD